MSFRSNELKEKNWIRQIHYTLMVNIKIYLRSNTNQSFLVDQTIFSRFRDGKIVFFKMGSEP